MKNHSTYLKRALIACCFLFYMSSSKLLNAQITVEINTGVAGTPAHNSGPVYRSTAGSAYDACRYCYLYTQAELTAAGITNGATITEVGWTKANGTMATGPAIFNIYMKNSSTAAFGNATETWANLNAGATATYQSTSFVMPATQSPNYIMFTLTTPFVYTGGSLEICSEWDINGVTGNPTTGTFQWLWSTVVDRVYGRSDQTHAATGTLSSTSNSINTIDDRRPFIQMTYLPAGPCTSPPTAGTSTSGAGAVTCPGDAVQLGLSGNSFGTGQDYQWQSAASIGGPYTNIGSPLTLPSLTVNPTATTFYRCEVTCSAMSATSTPVEVTITPPVAPAVAIATVETNICSGASTLFDAVPTNGGTTPSYQWKIDGVNAGTDNDTLITTAITAAAVVTCEMTSSEQCVTSATATSNAINMTTISRLPTSVTITASTSDTICEGTQVTFTATPVNGGTTPSFQWKKSNANVGTDSDTYTDIDIKDKQFVNCLMTSSEDCVTSAVVSGSPVLFVVNDLPTKPTVTVAGNDLTSSVASTYQWKLDNVDIAGATAQTHTAVTTGDYSVAISDANSCANTSDATFVQSTVGIAETSDKDVLSIYPSPFDDQLTVELKKEIGVYQLEIINASGQVVHSKQVTSQKEVIDLSALNSGLYLLNIRWDDELISKQVLKN